MFSYFQDTQQEHFEDELQQGDVLLHGACVPLNNPSSQGNQVSSFGEDNRNTDNSYRTNLTEHSTSLPGSSRKLTMSEVVASSGKHISDSTCLPLVSTLIQNR